MVVQLVVGAPPAKRRYDMYEGNANNPEKEGIGVFLLDCQRFQTSVEKGGNLEAGDGLLDRL